MPIQIAKVREFKGHTQAIYTLCMSPEKDCFYSAGADGMIVEWNLENTDGLLFAKSEFPIYSMCIRKNVMLSGTSNGLITILDIPTKSVTKKLQLHASAVFDIQTYGDKYLVVQENGYLSVFDSEFNLLNDIRISNESLRKILIVGSNIYITGRDGTIRQLNENFQVFREIDADSITIFSLAFHVEKKILLSGGRSAILKFWSDSEEIKHINAHLLHIKDIAFNPTFKYFVTSSMDKTIKLWDAENFELLKVIDFEKYEAHRSSVNKILWIGINRFISCSDDRTLMCFEIKE